MKRIVSFILVLCLLLSLCAFEVADEDPVDAPVCTCGAVDGDPHAEVCPLYVAPADEVTPEPTPEAPAVCTCGQPDGVHTADCPLYEEEPEEPISDEALAIYDAFMSCTTESEVDAILSGMTEEELQAFADEIGVEKITALEMHFSELVNQEDPEEPEVIEDNRTIVYPTVGFTDAVPMFEAVPAGPVATVENEEIAAEEPSIVPSRFSLRSVPAQETTTDKNAGDTTANNGLELRKWVQTNDGGSYTVNLEAWTTGVVITTQTTKPMDIVLVIDQSGSMAENFTNITEGNRDYHPTTAKQVYDNFTNVWVKLEDGSLAPVKVKRETIYVEPPTSVAGQTNSWLYNNQNKLFYKDEDGNYKKATVTRDWVWTGFLQGYWQYTYSWDGGSTTSDEGENASPEISKNLYIRNTDNQYTFTYVDGNGNVIGGPVTVIGDNSAPPDWNYVETFSESSTQPRLDALVNAVNGFVDNVAEKADPDGIPNSGDEVDHRIAVVGFSSSGYMNTELLTGVTITTGTHNYGTNTNNNRYYPTGYEKNGLQYEADNGDSVYENNGETVVTSADYAKALQSVGDSTGKANVEAAVAALTAHGGTYTDQGIAMANQIFANNEIDSEERSRVVIVFTDGVPGLYGYDSTVAGNAISEANTSKNTYGAKVYSIGIFDGADASSAGSQNGNDKQKANWFMQNVSSNNGTPQTPSFYLSASNSSELNEIFQNISNTASSSPQNLGSETVVRDIVSPYFTVPDGAAVTLQVADYNGTSFGDAHAAPSNVRGNVKDGVLDVTGFDFNANFIADKGRVEGNPNAQGDFYGRKLIIQFNITPKAGFLGGNGVPTNGEDSGIYSSSTATEATEKFAVPKVDVPIGDITVTAADKNVYLLGSVTESELISGATIKCGTVDITNWNALEDWQKAYVTFSASANPTGVTNAMTDTPYTLTATLTPTDATGSLAAKSGSDTATVNVFTPVVTFKDSQVYYGDTMPNNFDANKVREVWKHGDTLSTAVTMLDDAPPTITYSYTTGKSVMPNEDVPVTVTAKIGNQSITPTYEWQKCSESETKADTAQFIVHPLTCSLTITKSAASSLFDENDSFIFTVTGNNTAYPVSVKAVITGKGSTTIVGLPVGTYTVTEDGGWSWRYTVDDSKSYTSDTVSADHPIGAVTVTNALNINKWLSGSSYAVNTWQKNGSVVRKVIDTVASILKGE